MNPRWGWEQCRCQMKNDALEHDDDSLNFTTGVWSGNAD
jgi:hypothetical protein